MARKILNVLWLVAVSCLPVQAWAQDSEQVTEPLPESETPSQPEPARTLVAVLFLATGEVDEGLAENLTEVLVASIASAGRFTIVGREQFGTAMGVGGEEETLRCAEDPVCLGRIGTLIGAEEVVLGALGERAGRYLVNLSRFDVRRARLVHRVFRATPHELGPLISMVGEGARELMRPPPGAVRITVNVSESELVLDGELVEGPPPRRGRGGGPRVVRGLEPGEHVLLVRAEGYDELEQAFQVERGETTELTLGLSRTPIEVVEERPWYRRWWVWTILGVVVVGAGTATAVALTSDDSESVTGTLGTHEVP